MEAWYPSILFISSINNKKRAEGPQGTPETALRIASHGWRNDWVSITYKPTQDHCAPYVADSYHFCHSSLICGLSEHKPGLEWAGKASRSHDRFSHYNPLDKWKNTAQFHSMEIKEIKLKGTLETYLWLLAMDEERVEWTLHASPHKTIVNGAASTRYVADSTHFGHPSFICGLCELKPGLRWVC